MEKIKGYDLVTGTSKEDLVKQMDLKIQAGWQPFGSMSIVQVQAAVPGRNMIKHFYNQLIVRY